MPPVARSSLRLPGSIHSSARNGSVADESAVPRLLTIVPSGSTAVMPVESSSRSTTSRTPFPVRASIATSDDATGQGTTRPRFHS